MESSDTQIINQGEEAFLLILDINGDIERVFHISIDTRSDGLAIHRKLLVTEINLSKYYNLLKPETECPVTGCTGELQKDEENNYLICLDCGFSLPSDQ